MDSSDIPATGADGRRRSGSGKPTGWHLLTAAESVSRLGTDPEQGLTDKTARARLLESGPNELAREQSRTLLEIVSSQFADFMILTLIVAAMISGLIGELGDTLTIVVIVLLNAIIGATQEFRAQRAVDALRRLSAPEATVIRSGGTRRVSAAALVPGDVVLLEAGNVVPADLRLAEVAGLEVDESMLTGESLPVDKSAEPLTDSNAPIAERANMVYKSTSVTSGRARGIVVATGRETEVGRIAGLLGTPRRAETPLQNRLRNFSRRLALLIILICAVIFVIGLLGGQPPQLMFLVALSLAVAAIPEALPAVVAVSLALGARKLSSRNSLVRNLMAVESLGSITCICTDKTGTLTENRMTLASVATAGRTAAGIDQLPSAVGAALGRAMALCHDLEDADTGDPTELALVESAKAAGFHKENLESQLRPITAFAFDANRKRMTTVHASDSGTVAYTKGAPEQVVGVCTAIMDDNGRPAPLQDRVRLLDQAHGLAAEGHRVLAFATRTWADELGEAVEEDIESGMVFVGFAVLHDPIRAEVPGAIAECRSAGIRTIMITGDHPATARRIAQRIGLTSGDDEVLTGRVMAGLSDDELREGLARTNVCARVDPTEKIRIVRALQANGELVAMTGDGVNDAPALKQATIGVAMGQRGTDVARETADLVLLDDNFTTIVTAIREGRRIYGNIRKFIRYTMTSNTGEIAVLLLAPLLALPMPLLPAQILWINLVTDGFPGLAFSVEPAEPDSMNQPPRPPAEGVFARGLGRHMAVIGVLIAGLSLATYIRVEPTHLVQWQTMVFTTLVSAQLFQALALRSESSSLNRIGWFTNPWMLATVIATLSLQVLVIYLPFFNAFLHTMPLSATDLAVCIGLGATILPIVELQKRIGSRRLIGAK